MAPCTGIGLTCKRGRRLRPLGLMLAVMLGCLLVPRPAEAYIGPGAGFAFVSSFLILLVTSLLAVLTLLTLPVRWVFVARRRRRALRRGRFRKVVVIGLDGLDPDLTERFLARGLLPNFQRLGGEGTYTRLDTTLLAESPVAWASFQTGCHPGRHRIFDFLVPNRQTYLPELSSARIRGPRRFLEAAGVRFPLERPRVLGGRRSEPFWKTLGSHGVFSTILRVPITFPPDKFHGVMLSAMCAPDLKGSQGTYVYLSSAPDDGLELRSGVRIPLEVTHGVARGYLPGPENPFRREGGELRVPLEARPHPDGSSIDLRVGDERHHLRRGEFTPWMRLAFRALWGIKVRGICRLYLMEAAPEIRLYATPIQIDPEKPALPISHPWTYAVYLAKTLGTYATLGVAEGLSAVNEGVLDEEGFLLDAYSIHDEREKMLFDALEKTRSGVVACVFDLTDRIQHIFFRHQDPEHPANRGRDVEKHQDVLRETYQRVDDLVARVRARLSEDTLLLVMSDHGFKTFRRQVNLNTWLLENGYLARKPGGGRGDMFRDVDWSRTRAYAVGFGGIYCNVRGRERHGIVQPGADLDELKHELAERLRDLRDPLDGTSAVREVYDTRRVYHGPYAEEAADVIVGFRPGYRAAWSSVTGGFDPEVFSDNTRPWSGDHNFNPGDVPGVLFSSHPLARSRPSIVDLAPTILEAVGVPAPAACDGTSLLSTEDDTAGDSVEGAALPVPQEASLEAVQS